MTKKIVFTIMLAAFLCVIVLAGLVIAAEQKMPDKIQFNNEDVYGKMKKGPVPFDHAKHSGELKIACAECHHVYKDGENVWKQGDEVHKCSECHKAKKEGDAPKLMNAFHKNCKDCHKQEKKGLYKKCDDCHGEKS